MKPWVAGYVSHVFDGPPGFNFLSGRVPPTCLRCGITDEDEEFDPDVCDLMTFVDFDSKEETGEQEGLAQESRRR